MCVRKARGESAELRSRPLGIPALVPRGSPLVSPVRRWNEGGKGVPRKRSDLITRARDARLLVVLLSATHMSPLGPLRPEVGYWWHCPRPGAARRRDSQEMYEEFNGRPVGGNALGECL